MDGLILIFSENKFMDILKDECPLILEKIKKLFTFLQLNNKIIV